MFVFDIARCLPRFLLRDQTGYAMAKAIQAGMQMMNDAIAEGVKRVHDVNAMPEWRLDEMAWEYNIPYDYKADISVKREWVRSVQRLSKLYGTPEGITRYMAGYFDTASLQEAWEYGGKPFHFRVVFPDSWTPENVAWATTAVEKVKNVRSVLDSYIFDARWMHGLFAGCALYTYEATTYRVPAVVVDNDWYLDEMGDMLLDENGILLIVEG